MKPHELLQPGNREDYASTCWRVEIDTKRVTPADLFNPDYWVNNTILKKGHIIRCVANDGSYAFDLIVTSQRLDTAKSVKNHVTVSMFPRVTDEVIFAAEDRAEVETSDNPSPAVVREPAPPAPSPAPSDKPAIGERPGQVSYAKRKQMEKRQKILDKRVELDARNKARTAERLAASDAA
jgi:hypothetical protein